MVIALLEIVKKKLICQKILLKMQLEVLEYIIHDIKNNSI